MTFDAPFPPPPEPATRRPDAAAEPGPSLAEMAPPVAEMAPPVAQQRGRLGIGGAIALGVGVLVTAAYFSGFGWMLGNQQRIVDQFVVWDYEPDTAITTYADRADLTEEGRFLFYASRPSVEPEEKFDSICSSGNEGFGILGCYLPGERRIYLYDVTDDRLDGIEEVVATHEMLHAAWDRMSADEHDALEPLLEAEAAELADNETFVATMDFYAQAEPGQRLNELHSILGTEYGDLSAGLESHYAEYIGDRTLVLALHDQSNAVFLEQQERAEALVAQLDELAAGIDTDYANYSAGYDALNADVDSFNSRADAGDFSSESQFNAERNALLARQTDLDNTYTAIVARQDQYNALVAELEALNEEIDGLNASINIDPPDIPDLSG